MLATSLRLNLAKATWRFRKADFAASSPFFKILARRNKTERSRFGFLVSGKVGRAVKRNQIKRWLTECVAASLGGFPKGLDFVFIVYPNDEVTHEKLCTSLNQVLPKISLFR